MYSSSIHHSPMHRANIFWVPVMFTHVRQRRETRSLLPLNGNSWGRDRRNHNQRLYHVKYQVVINNRRKRVRGWRMMNRSGSCLWHKNQWKPLWRWYLREGRNKRREWVIWWSGKTLFKTKGMEEQRGLQGRTGSLEVLAHFCCSRLQSGLPVLAPPMTSSPLSNQSSFLRNHVISPITTS